MKHKTKEIVNLSSFESTLMFQSIFQGFFLSEKNNIMKIQVIFNEIDALIVIDLLTHFVHQIVTEII